MNKLLIVEESLRDRKAHWFEYIKHITAAASSLGWKTKVACHGDVEDVIKQDLDCLPIFKYARYLDSGNKKLPGEHYYGFILHSIRVFKAMKPIVKQNQFDYVFCPTVTVHHLLAWYVLLKLYPQNIQKLCLFFVTNPGVWDAHTQTVVYPKSSKIFGRILEKFGSYVEAGKVVLGVETLGAKTEFEHISGVNFALFPHPVPFALEQDQQKGNAIHLACYGFARYEKGSDILQEAITHLLETGVENVHFTIQWTDGFDSPDGTKCEVNSILKQSSQVTIIDKAMNSDEYQSWLKRTDGMLLPYRNSSYYARVSRVAIEATNMGIPCVYTKGGWLEDTISEYGSGVGIDDESVEALVKGIKEIIGNFKDYKTISLQNKTRSIAYFQPYNFCKQLLAYG
ncbi:glycosyltransferase [Mangrovimonas xylaniphaga]|uniref:glycosyltransferase n=1 Tax=Mangrovimonas xylaniphaga TaxID=1645915 RepID=UPI0006B57B07|nr:glycosyltransferase [Mangrovimonas xylaniphaga]